MEQPNDVGLAPETPSLPPFLLRTDMVQPGDVVLMLGSEKKSGAIASFSGGRYSHAALCITSDMIFESDGGIIDRKLLQIVGWATMGGLQVRLGAVPGRPNQFALYRHPRMSEISEARFRQVLLEEMSDSYGKDYSEMFRLAPLAQTAPAIKAALDFYYRMEHKLRYAENVPGPFCSELVARFYDRLGLPLFSQPTRPELVSPNHLAASNLERIEDAVAASAGLSIQPASATPFDGWLRSPEWKDPFASYLNWQRKLEVSLDQLDEMKASIDDVRLSNGRMLNLMIESFEKSVPHVVEHIKEASGMVSPLILVRTTRLSKRYMWLANHVPTLMSAYANNNWDVVLTVVRNLKRFECSALRCNLLLELHKRKMRLLASNWCQRCRNDREARRVVVQVRRRCRHLIQLEDIVLDALVSHRETERLLTAK
jgi:hypothetical protein